MNSLRCMVALIAAFAVTMTGSVQAQTNLGTLSSDIRVFTETDLVAGASFEDIFNFTVGGTNHTVLASAVGTADDGTPTAGLISNLTLDLYAGSGAAGSALETYVSADGSLIDLAKVLGSGEYSARISGVANGEVGGGFQFSIAAVPEPAEWMMLLAGLVVVGFMARRKSSLVTG